MRTTRFLLLLAGLTAFSAWAAPSGDRPKSKALFDIAGGVTFPTGSAASRFNPGWNLKLGAGVNLSQSVAVLGEYLFSSLPSDSTVRGTDISARQYIHTFGLSGMFSVGRNQGVSAYVIGGPGAYYRRITVSQYAGTAVAPFCDPYFFYCYAAPVPVSTVIGTRSEWDFGLNAGLGIEYGFAGGEPHVFLEARYHYIFGQTYTKAGYSANSSAGFVPLILGVRW